MLFLCYPRCSTCARARAWLEAEGIPYTFRDIREERPGPEELRRWHAMSGLPLRRFFNSSGLRYRELGLKERLDGMTEEEQLALLASDGMLLRRPLAVGEDFVLLGFREKEWRAALKGEDCQ